MFESKEDISRFGKKIMEYITHSGACAVGVCNADSLEGGPPSADLTREMPSAKSAFVFAVPLDDDIIEAYMGKIDHGKYQSHYIRTNIVAEGIASSACHFLRGQGYEAQVVNAGNTTSGGDGRDVTPQNDSQRAAAEKYPTTDIDMMIGTIPVLSQRFLAAAAGVGYFGRSGNILTSSHGASVVLGALVTSMELEATPPIPHEENYCDNCNWCEAVCPTTYMSRTENNNVQLGEMEHTYSKRMHPGRCASYMMGSAGLAENGKFSAWGPGRKTMPKEDDQVLIKLIEISTDMANRPQTPGGFVNPPDQGEKRMNINCSACNLVCHPEREVRRKRVKLWTQGGVSVQHEDGTLESMPREEAEAFIAAMTPERRALYE
ncbi:MAG: hypothetical protein CL691_06945 [Cellvibrionales bacterium]|nr:hypothetical protein [Cellvibrionales bacterium]|tara:strand:+ start:7081 stop:8208 length:1128 start_codon:yes stop_codon:yes gene_type:complete